MSMLVEKYSKLGTASGSRCHLCQVCVRDATGGEPQLGGARLQEARQLNLTQVAMGEPFVTLPFYALLVALTLRWRRLARAP